MLIRKAHVSGTFYPDNPDELSDYCRTHLETENSACEAKAVILPHAGYFYSGETAAAVLRRVKPAERVLLIGPNHRGTGDEFALPSADLWSTPLGDVPIDRSGVDALLDRCDELTLDDNAHAHEHSLEVVLPFLQTLNPHTQVIPLAVGTLDLIAASRVALACGQFIRDSTERFLVVISNDMSHYEPDHVTREKDRFALDAITALDAEALADAVRHYRITMCGFIPVYMLLVMRELLNIKRAELVDYRTSADATGEKDRVVGYAGFIFK